MFIVETDELLRDSMVLFFRTKGFRTMAFASAEEASRGLETRPPDVVICGQELPGMDGVTFLSCLGASHPDAIRILISATSGARLAADARRAGVDDHLLKPFSIEEIERTLSRRFRSRSEGGDAAGGGADEVPDRKPA